MNNKRRVRRSRRYSYIFHSFLRDTGSTRTRARILTPCGRRVTHFVSHEKHAREMALADQFEIPELATDRVYRNDRKKKNAKQDTAK